MRRLLCVLALSSWGAEALTARLEPARAGRAAGSACRACASLRSAVARMQVEAPIKTPDIQLAPTDPKGDEKSDKGKKFKLLLFNDTMNKREYVARILQQSVPGLTAADAYLIMQKAHKSGMAVVFELAEAYCDLLKAGGLIASVTEDE